MKLLVAVDGSPASNAAIDHAEMMATAANGDVILAHAVDPDVYEATGGSGVRAGDVEDRLVVEAVEDAEADGRALLEAATERIETPGLVTSTELVYGDPVGTLATVATERNVDGIVVGHRSLSERHERLLGSVAKGLIEEAPVPVTVVRSGNRRQ